MKNFKSVLLMALVVCLVVTAMPIQIFGATTQKDLAMGSNYQDPDQKQGGITVASRPAAPNGTLAKGVDISHWDEKINFKSLAKVIDFAIVRCGYGSDYKSQDDRRYEEYIKGCRDNNIPYGVYIYAHAKNVNQAKSEARHTIRQLNKLKGWKTKVSLPIFYDMEDNDQAKLSSSQRAKIAKAYCTAVENAGYTTGVYANKYWWTTKLTNAYFDTKIKWVAQYSSACTYKKPYAIWQCSESAKVSGIPVKADYNYMIRDIFLDEQTSDVPMENIKRDVQAKGYNAAYDGKAHSITVKYGTDVMYSTDQENWTTKAPTRTSVGTRTVYYKARDYKNKEVTGSKDIVITERSIKTCKVSLSAERVVYKGTKRKPAVTVKYAGKKLSEEKDYVVTYGENTNYGVGTVTVTGQNNLTGSVKKTFYIVTAKPQITKAKKTKGKVQIKWEKVEGATGYKVAYRKSGSKKWRYKTISSASTVSKTLTGLSKKKPYYVKVRTYVKVNGKIFSSYYSGAKKTNVK